MWYTIHEIEAESSLTQWIRNKQKGQTIMKKIFSLLFLSLLLLANILSGCSKIDSTATTPAPVVVKRGQVEEEEEQEDSKEESEPELQIGEIVIDPDVERTQVKVKGIYISAYVAGTPSMVDSLLEKIDQTEINTLVIDLKDDFGRVACEMDSPLVKELGSVRVHIRDKIGRAHV